jgi:hypothetical protein
MLRGSCLCGGIRYEISGELYDALNCHCFGGQPMIIIRVRWL